MHEHESREKDKIADATTVDGAAANAHAESAAKAPSVRHKVEDLEASGYVLVGFEDGDPENPRNWSKAKKYFLVTFCSYINVLVASQASAYSTGEDGVQEDFGISKELSTIGLSLYVLGFAIGPPLVAPLSEQFGRRPVYLVCWALFVLFAFGPAFSPTFAGVAITRFLQGLFSSPPLANTGGVVSDVIARDAAGPYMAIYTWGSTIGPAVGNVYAAYIAPKMGSWRYIFYFTSLLAMGCHWPIIYFFLPETRHNIILERKAARLRKSTGSDRFVSVHATEKKSLRTSLYIALTRPFRFLFTEPITAFAAAWNGFLYGLIFLFNTAFIEIWGENGYGFNAGLSQLSFISLIVGCTIGFLSHRFTSEPHYQRVIKQRGESVPEARLYMGLFGSILLPIGLFITAWTCYPGKVHWIVPMIGAAIFGIGFYWVLYGILTYVTDSYTTYSASALGAAILIRNILGAVFPLFAGYQFQNLGNHWATSLIAFLSLPLVPITFFFWKKGHLLREASPWASAHFNEDEDAPH
ncbi:MFS general substrate transporter [Jaminaea rosea]|uniref:MFS general substrate transporter n=1 Tax=Jaminaea rosea TaxID=1569628 RepID=A0A316UWI5_9BASI|nr:MFS general substrate transporter [Jaminaea rosea]PWN29592.1 MFS general substrate transporter [Jaminaea rosea]